MKTKITFAALPKDYRGLLSLHMVRPIHDKVEYENALEILDALAGRDLNRDQGDYFEALSLLVESYEAERLPSFGKKKGLSLLKHLLEENEMSAADLARLLGIDRSLGVRIVNGERHLTVEHILKLVRRFRLPAEVFLGT